MATHDGTPEEAERRRSYLSERRLTDFLGDKGRLRYFVNQQGLCICGYLYPAVAAAKATLLLVHGHAAYFPYEFLHIKAPGVPETYKGSWIEILNQQGYSVCAIDQQGCGRSESVEGLRSYVVNFDYLVEDICSFTRLVQNCGLEGFERSPIFLCGASMGGCVAFHASVREPELFKGVILLAPMLSLEKVSKKGLNPYLRPLASVLATVLPALEVAEVDSNTKFPLQQESWEKDPVNYHGRSRARTAFEYLRACERAMRDLHRMTLPLLIFHSEQDTITDPDASKKLYEAAKSTDKELHLVSHMWHVLPKEDGNRELLNEIILWMEQRR